MLHAMERPAFRARVDALFRSHPMVGILGPRQCGKTTLARDYVRRSVDGSAGEEVHCFDLQDPEHLALLAEPKWRSRLSTGSSSLTRCSAARTSSRCCAC